MKPRRKPFVFPQPIAKYVVVRESSALRAEDSQCFFGWYIFFLLLIALLVAILVVSITYPYNNPTYYRDSSPNARDNRGRINCTEGEVLDRDLEICAPIINLPIPISPELMDNSVRPCKSFFHHMSGKWIKSHRNENRGFTFVHRKNQKIIHDIIKDKRSGPVYTFYRSCLDTLVHKQHKILDRSQVKHVKEHILGALLTHGDLPVVFARLAAYGFTSPFTLAIEPHPTELKMVPMIRRDNFGSETSELVKRSSAELGRTRQNSNNQFSRFAPELIPQNPLDLLEVVTILESFATDEEFRGDFIDYVQSARYDRDMVTFGALLDISPENFWKNYLRELNGYAMQEEMEHYAQVWLIDREYIRNLMQGLTTISVENWRKYVEFSIDHHTNNFLPDLPSDSYFRIHNPIKRNSKYRHLMKRDMTPQYSEESCIDLTHKLLPGMIGNIFLAKTVKMDQLAGLKKNVTEIVESVRDSFADILLNCSWLSEKSRQQAVDKVRSIIVRSVVPTYYETEPFADRLTIDNYLRNLNIIRQYFAKRNLELWTSGQPDRDLIQRFGAPLTNVNAFYSPITNTITIFAGILAGPFWNRDFDIVAKYATLGMIAGHEMGHAMDVHGRLFDKDGSLYRKDPWNSTEIATFKGILDNLAKEYVAPFGCENNNYGHQTSGEDTADILGIRAAYGAMVKFLRKQSPQNSTEFEHPSDDQAKMWFFEIFAQMWAESYEKEEYCERIANDEHAIAEFRVDKTLRQITEFHRLFGCKVGDGMVNPEPVVIY